MKRIILCCALITATQNAFSDNQRCSYREKNSCPSGFYCIHFEKNKDVCLAYPKEPMPRVEYPFDSTTKSICDQGNLSPEGNSHTWANTAFAIDLQGDRSKKENKVYAGVDGVVIVFNECKTNESAYAPCSVNAVGKM